MSKTFLTEHFIGNFDFYPSKEKEESEFNLEVRIYSSKKHTAFFHDDHGPAIVEEIYEFPKHMMFKVRYTTEKLLNLEIVFILSGKNGEYTGEWKVIGFRRKLQKSEGKAFCRLQS